jgi:hypothetical protein
MEYWGGGNRIALNRDIRRMVNYMRTYNYFFISFNAWNYTRALQIIKNTLNGIGNLTILFYHSWKEPFAFYCRFEYNEGAPNVEITANELQQHLRNTIPSISVQNLLFPFEVSKSIISYAFHGSFKT